MSIQSLSHFKNRLSNYVYPHSSRIPWSVILNPKEFLSIFSELERQDEKGGVPYRIEVGHKVTLFDVHEKDILTLRVTNPRDSNPETGHISCLSPLGRQMIGRISGEVIYIKIFSRTAMFRIVRIEH